MEKKDLEKSIEIVSKLYGDFPEINSETIQNNSYLINNVSQYENNTKYMDKHHYVIKALPKGAENPLHGIGAQLQGLESWADGIGVELEGVGLQVDGAKELLSTYALKSYQIIDEMTNGILAVNEQLVKAIRSTLQFQTEMIIRSSVCSMTKALSTLQSAFIKNEYHYGINALAKSLEQNTIQAADLAFYKSDISLQELLPARNYKLSGIINEIQVVTAKQMLSAKDISFNKRNKNFNIEAAPECSASIRATNIICAGLEIFPFTYVDMMEFNNYISNYPMLASEHSIGKRIYQMIENWVTFINFSDEYYYHARAFKDGQSPYTDKEMCSAPKGITWHGRYNFPSESHYYFSDKPKGAIQEIKKHCNCNNAQVASLRPKRDIRMVDLAGEKKGCKFLEYCRFPLRSEEYIIIKPEYLVPSFVASCCKKCGIEGIKYYGSKEYNNYVCWDDGYFEFVKHEIWSI